MTPNILKNSLPILTEELQRNNESKKTVVPKKNWKNLWCYFGNEELKWYNIFLLGTLHIFSLYCIYHIFFVKHLWFRAFTFCEYTSTFREHDSNLILSDFPIGYISALGVTAGAHRYYTHKCYKMKFPLRVFLVLAHASAGMVIFETFQK